MAPAKAEPEIRKPAAPVSMANNAPTAAPPESPST